MNWYQHIIQNLAVTRDLFNLANDVSKIFVNVDKGVPVDDHLLYNIVSKMPSEESLQKSVELGLQLASVTTGIKGVTPERQEVIQNLNETFYRAMQEKVDNITNVELAQENYTGDDQIPQVQQEG